MPTTNQRYAPPHHQPRHGAIDPRAVGRGLLMLGGLALTMYAARYRPLRALLVTAGAPLLRQALQRREHLIGAAGHAVSAAARNAFHASRRTPRPAATWGPRGWSDGRPDQGATKDKVQVASEGSFPASDPPAHAPAAI